MLQVVENIRNPPLEELAPTMIGLHFFPHYLAVICGCCHAWFNFSLPGPDKKWETNNKIIQKKNLRRNKGQLPSPRWWWEGGRRPVQSGFSYVCFYVCSWWHVLNPWPKFASNGWSSCLHLLRAKLQGMQTRLAFHSAIHFSNRTRVFFLKLSNSTLKKADSNLANRPWAFTTC